MTEQHDNTEAPQDQETTAKTSWPRRVVRWGGRFLVALLLFLFCVGALTQTAWFRDKLRQEIVERVNAQIKGRLEIGEIDGNLVTGLIIRDVAIYDGRKNLALKAGAIDAGYSLPGLPEAFTLERGEIKGLVTVIRMYPDGTLNLNTITAPSKKSKDSGPLKLILNLKSIKLDGGQIIYLDQRPLLDQQPAHPAIDRVATSLNGPINAMAPDAMAAHFKPLIQGSTKDMVPKTVGVFDLNATLHGTLNLAGPMTLDLPTLNASTVVERINDDLAIKSKQLAVTIKENKIKVSHELMQLSTGTFYDQLDLHVTLPEATTDPKPDAMPFEQLSVSLKGVHINEKLVNAWAPQPILKRDITINTAISGTPELLDLKLNVLTDDAGTIAFKGVIKNIVPYLLKEKNKPEPGYDATLTINALRPDMIVEDVPKTQLNAVLSAKGKGVEPKTLESVVDLRVTDSLYAPYKLELAAIKAVGKDGKFTIEEGVIKSPYLDALIEGFGTLDGVFDIALKAERTKRHDDQLNIIKDQPIQNAKANVDLKVKGKLDLNNEDPVGKLQRLNVDGKWSFRQFKAEDIILGEHDADVDIKLTSPSAKTRRVLYDVKITGKNIDTPQARAGWVDIQSEGSLVLDVPFENTFSVMRRLMMTTTLKGKRVRGFGIVLNRISTKLTLNPGQGSGYVDYTLRGSLNGLRIPKQQLTLGEAIFDLEGWLKLNLQTKDAANLLSRIHIKGTTRTTDLDIKDTANVRGARIKLDLEGKPPNLAGKVAVQAAKVRAQNERFNTVNLIATIDERKRYKVDLQADRITGRPNKVDVEVVGTLSDDFQKIGVKRLQVNLPNGKQWVMKDTTINTRGGQLAFDNLNFSRGDQTLQIDGAYRPRGKQTLEAKASNVRIETLLQDTGLDAVVPEIKGTINTLDFSIKGTAAEPIIRLVLNIEDFYYQEFGPFSLKLMGRYQKERLTITRMDLNGYGRDFVDGQVRMPMAINLKTKRYKLNWDASLIASIQVHPIILQDLAKDVPQLAMYRPKGSIEAIATMSGSLKKPTLDTLIRAKEIGIDGAFGGQQITFEGLSMESRLDYKPPTQQSGGLVFKGWLDWLATPGEKVKGVKRVHWLLNTPLPFAQWINDFIKTNKLPEPTTDILNKPFELNLAINQLDLGKISIDPLFREADAAGSLSMNLTGDGTFLKPSVDFEVGLGLVKRDTKGLVVSSAGGLGWKQYRDIVAEGKLAFKRNKLVLKDFQLNWDKTDMVKINASLPIDMKDVFNQTIPTDFPLQAKVEVLPIPIRKFQAVTYDLAAVPGTLKGELTLSGRVKSPTIKGGLFLEDTQVGQYGKGRITVDVEANNNVISLESAIIKKSRRLLSVVSRARLNLDLEELSNGSNPLEVVDARRTYTPGEDKEQLTAQQDLLVSLKTFQGRQVSLKELLPKYVTDKFARRYNGWIQSDIRVAGKWDDLNANGSLKVGDGLIYVNEWGRTFSNIALGVSLKDDTISLDTLKLKEGPTSISATGNVQHKNFKPGNINLTAKTNQFNIGDFVEQRFFASSDIIIKGDLSSDPIKTDVEINNLDVILPENLGGSLHSTSLDSDIAVLTPVEAAKKRAFFKKLTDELYASEQESILNANINVKLGKNSKVFHPAYGRVGFKGKVGVRLARGEAELSGGIQTVSGKVEFLGKEFQVAKGFINFTGSTPPDPRLQVEAEHILERNLIASIGQPTQGRDPKITIRITGNASDPQLKLLSDPQMTDTDILYILATGRPPENSEVGQDAGVISAALGAASGLFLGLLQQELQGKIPVQIRLDAGDEGLSDSTIQIGRYITEDIFVSYKHQFGGTDGTSQNTFSVEYHFAPRWMMEAQYSDNNQGQFNVFWDAK